MSNKSFNLAVLIDADNTSHKFIASILEEVAKYGAAYVKHVYGDWSSPALKSWKEKCLSLGLIAIQQFSYTSKKNATDIAMVIDAMDLLHSSKFDGFCLVSSDSDFTGLASRIRKEGGFVYGIGTKQAPEAFRMSCDKFIFTENLTREISEENEEREQKEEGSDLDERTLPTSATDLRSDAKLISLIRNGIKEHESVIGFASLGAVGSYINKLSPEFDSRNYGYEKLSELIQTIGFFSYGVRNNQIYISNKIPNDEWNRIFSVIKESIIKHKKDDDWARIQSIGTDLRSNGISYKELGYTKLSDFLETVSEIEVKEKKVLV